MMNNKWQPVSTAPINRLVLVLVSYKGGEEKPYGSLGMFESESTRGWHANDEYLTGWHVNNQYLTESSDDKVIGWMELPLSNDDQDMDWIVN